jgi:hypothetical protein
MKLSEFKYPVRVWINQPSTLQPHHRYHEKCGIAMIDPMDKTSVRIYFCTGSIESMQIDPLCLAKCGE